MLSYRYMYMHMDGHQAGTDSLSTHQVFQRGYAVAAEEMDMHMHMWSAMYAPTDNLTFMAMLNYVEKDMELVANPHGMMHGHDMGHGGGHMGRFGHSGAGLGDFSLGALYKLYDDRSSSEGERFFFPLRWRIRLGFGFAAAGIRLYFFRCATSPSRCRSFLSPPFSSSRPAPSFPIRDASSSIPCRRVKRPNSG